MNYSNVITGIFISRPNRFIAHVRILADNKKEKMVICHVKNTGRCRELLIPGVEVILTFHPEASVLGRKTDYSLIGVWKERDKDRLLINMDSQAPNQVAFEWLSSNSTKLLKPQQFLSLSKIRREVSYDQSRFDLAFQIVSKNQEGALAAIPAFMEVKGVTLEEQNVAMFPDAPTIRGVKHIMELIRARKEGYETYLLFVIQMKGMVSFTPNQITHPEFGTALKAAKEAGVHILAYDCTVTKDSLSIDQPVPVSLT
ncbi:DNA/RNA nuclease SfsA [Clostridium sp. E02]|uniref:DNA/RNA nuclease SfsA n=1 Tax=Clostridium sp. E02 TaxID=2487134 RepID=UPI000F52A745|nr:DNA/RNA nuclease SfsA [Clostridium sp. E02]